MPWNAGPTSRGILARHAVESARGNKNFGKSKIGFERNSCSLNARVLHGEVTGGSFIVESRGVTARIILLRVSSKNNNWRP
jgi:hypothetical protein